MALLANGKLGAPSDALVDPETVPPQQYDPVVVDGIQVGDRVVWMLGGGSRSAFYLWACCTRAGELTPLTRLIDPKRNMSSLQLGLDSTGRLWLAWLDLYRRKSWGGVRMVELDPDTLSPRTPKPFVSPGPESWVQPPIYGAFVPGGLVFFKLYYNFRRDSETRVLVGSLPLGR